MTERKSWIKYLGACLAALLALALRELVEPVIGSRAPFSTFFLAMIFVAWWGGLGPALVTMVLGGFAAAYFVLAPPGTIEIYDRADLWSLLIYLTVGLAIAFMSGLHRRQQRRAETNAELAESRQREAVRQSEILSVTLASIGDAVIVTDAEGRVLRLNPVAEKLMEYTTAEAQGKPLEDVFRISNENTREDVPNPAVRAIREGAIVGLANHTLLISRSGKEIPIDDSAAPIRESDGTVLGAILIFRDITQRRYAEQSLKQSEALFRDMADTAPVLVWRANQDASREYFNKPWLAFTGRRAEQELGNGWCEGIHSDDYERCLRTYHKAVQARRSYQMEYRLRRHDGEFRWVVDSGIPRFSAEGSFEGFIGTCFDITDRKRWEQELLHISWVFENTDDAILTKSLDGTLLTWNKGAEKIYGYTAEQAIGQSVFMLVPEHRRQENIRILETVRTGEGLQSLITERRRADGELITVSLTVSPVRNAAGEIVGISTIARDITDQVRAEEAVRESEQNLRLALRAARMGTWNNDVAEGKVRWSPELNEIFGLPPGGFSGSEKDFFELIHPEDRDRVSGDIREAIETHKDYETEFRYRRADGTVGWMSGRGRAFYGPDGALVRLTGIGMDITQRKRLELELLQRTAELTRSNQELEQFAYVSSHDLQEPLRTIGAYVQLLARRYRGKFDADADEFIGFVVDGVRRMQEQIQALLDYSRVGASGRRAGAVEASQALHAALSNLKTAIDSSQARITYDPLPVVHANPTELGQVFQNLIANAIKFRSEETPRIHVSAERDGGTWRFAVQDNGIGIEPEYTKQIFEIFKRLDGGRREGTGIGLAICKKVVENYGGQIWVNSQPGSGSTFFFTLRPAAARTPVA
jgi:PAS domain S-box-containing protein